MRARVVAVAVIYILTSYLAPQYSVCCLWGEEGGVVSCIMVNSGR